LATRRNPFAVHASLKSGEGSRAELTIEGRDDRSREEAAGSRTDVTIVRTSVANGTATSPSRLLRTGEVVERLRYSPKTVRAMARLGILRAVRVGTNGHYRFNAESVEVFANRLGRDAS
jgi:excisionase family DNA binding protein